MHDYETPAANQANVSARTFIHTYYQKLAKAVCLSYKTKCTSNQLLSQYLAAIGEININWVVDLPSARCHYQSPFAARGIELVN